MKVQTRANAIYHRIKYNKKYNSATAKDEVTTTKTVHSSGEIFEIEPGEYPICKHLVDILEIDPSDPKEAIYADLVVELTPSTPVKTSRKTSTQE